MTRNERRVDRSARRAWLVPAVTVLGALLGLGVLGNGRGGEPVLFSDARIIIELNSTDEDVGMQVFLDGEGWRRVQAMGPDGRRIFDVKGRGGVGETGVTELFFESAEPSLEDVPLDEFLSRFPEGEYEFRGKTVEGERIVGTATLTHAIPAGPVLIAPEEDSVSDPEATVVVWEPVADPPGSHIFEYQVIVERDDILRVFSVHVPASVNRVTVPPEFLEPGRAYKFEVLAIEAGGNQTLSESTFETAE